MSKTSFQISENRLSITENHDYRGVSDFGRGPISNQRCVITLPDVFSEMVNASNPLFSESTVLNYDSNPVDKSHRDSWTAYLSLPSNPEENDDHAIIKCIEERAAQFQGYVPVDNMENLQVVKYSTWS